MSEENKTTTKKDEGDQAKKDEAVGQNEDKPQKLIGRKSERSFSGGGIRKRRNERRDKRGRDEKDEYEQKIIHIARVTRVMAGGKRMRFRACVAVGNRAGKVGIGLAKATDVTQAIAKAVDKAKKNIIKVQIINGTVAHELRQKFGAAKIILRPAKQGTGIIAGGAIRIVLELAGIKNIVGKILGTNNPVNNIKCVIEALKSLKYIEIKEDKKERKDSDKKEKEISSKKS